MRNTAIGRTANPTDTSPPPWQRRVQAWPFPGSSAFAKASLVACTRPALATGAKAVLQLQLLFKPNELAAQAFAEGWEQICSVVLSAPQRPNSHQEVPQGQEAETAHSNPNLRDSCPFHQPENSQPPPGQPRWCNLSQGLLCSPRRPVSALEVARSAGSR